MGLTWVQKRQKSKNSGRSIIDIIKDCIENQKILLDPDLENPKNPKGNDIKSWFSNGQMTPIISNLNFNSKNPSIECGNSFKEKMDLIEEFNDGIMDGSLKGFISDLEIRIQERNEKLRNRVGFIKT